MRIWVGFVCALVFLSLNINKSTAAPTSSHIPVELSDSNGDPFLYETDIGEFPVVAWVPSTVVKGETSIQVDELREHLKAENSWKSRIDNFGKALQAKSSVQSASTLALPLSIGVLSGRGTLIRLGIVSLAALSAPAISKMIDFWTQTREELVYMDEAHSNGHAEEFDPAEPTDEIPYVDRRDAQDAEVRQAKALINDPKFNEAVWQLPPPERASLEILAGRVRVHRDPVAAHELLQRARHNHD